MALPVNCMNLTAYYAVPAVVGSLTAAALIKSAHQTVGFGYNILNASIFAAVQAMVAGALHNNLAFTRDKETNFIVSHLVAGTSLYALTALAFRVSLAASCMTIPGAILIILATTASSFVGMLVTRYVERNIAPTSATST